MSKELGDYAEMRFALAAYEKGFSVLRPFSDNRPYDFVLEKDGVFYRVQVKSCSVSEDKYGSYHVTVAKKINGNRFVYTKNDCDLVVLYIREIDCFYLFPIENVTFKGAKLYPSRDGHKLNKFKEKWDF